MNRRLRFLVVRLLFLATVVGGAMPALADEPPATPANQIYDPDLLLPHQITGDLSQRLKDFQTKSDVRIYLAIYTIPPGVIREIAQTLNEVWNQSGYGIVVVFASRRHELRVLPSPELSLLEDSDRLTEVF